MMGPAFLYFNRTRLVRDRRREEVRRKLALKYFYLSLFTTAFTIVVSSCTVATVAIWYGVRL